MSASRRCPAGLTTGVLLWLATTSGSLLAQPGQTELEVVVTGNKGAPAPGLTAKDFSVWEDGKPQSIVNVQASSPGDSSTYFVIVFDFTAMTAADCETSKSAAADFINTYSRSDRYLAVLAPNVAPHFTTSKITALRDVGAAQQGVGLQKAPIQQTARMQSLAQALTTVPGRKALLLFTAGYREVDTKIWMKDLLKEMNQANTGVYIVGTAAPRPGNITASSGRNASEASLNRATLDIESVGAAGPLADGTGGSSFSLGDKLISQLAVVVREQNEYYRISYVPPPSVEGACHSIRIALSVRGLATRARNEYCTKKSLDLVAEKIRNEALSARANKMIPQLDLAMQLPYFYVSTNRASVHLALDFVPTGMKFDKVRTGVRGQIDLVGILRHPGGEVVRSFTDTINIERETPQQADAFAHASYSYEHQFITPPGTYELQVLVGAGPTATGTITRTVNIEPWTPSDFRTSEIALSAQAHLMTTSTDPDAPILDAVTPLIAGSREFTPAAVNRFRNSDHLYIYDEIYEPTLGGATPATVTAQVRILNRLSGALKVDSGMISVAAYIRADSSVIPFATAIPVAQLPPGSYRIEVRAAHSSSPDILSRSADFEIVN